MRLFLDPFFAFFALTWAAVTWMWWRREIERRRLIVMTIALSGLTISCTPVVVGLCGATLTRGYAPTIPPDADAIVVLAGSLRQLDDDWTRYQLGEDTLYRCLTAADIHRRTDGIPVFASGGKVDPTRPGPTLSAAMRDFLVRYNVPASDITVEEVSRNTFENAVETAKLLKEEKIRQPILVTDATHLPRAKACFALQGIDVLPYPAAYSTRQFEWTPEAVLPNASAARAMRGIVHEWVGLLWYRFKGRI